MIALWSAVWAAPVVCDAGVAARLVTDARIPEARVAVTHPELLPGIARSSTTIDGPLRDALERFCVDPAALSIATGETWPDSGWSAHSVVLTRSETRGCDLAQEAVRISVGVRADGPVTYSLESAFPESHTPIGACDVPSRWREERVVDGEGGPVRLFLQVDQEGAPGASPRTLETALVVRRATPEGWQEQTLFSPAPDRFVGGFDGPRVEVAPIAGETWVVAHGDRAGSPDRCAPRPGQTVWVPGPDGFEARTGRDALHLLASHGLARFAGDDAWLHVVTQEDEGDVAVLDPRERRIGLRYPEPLHRYVSSRLPGLNPGFLVVSPAPWPDEASARAAKSQWNSLRRHYVKRAWIAPNPCG